VLIDNAAKFLANGVYRPWYLVATKHQAPANRYPIDSSFQVIHFTMAKRLFGESELMKSDSLLLF
jgi:hypothetical protein